MVEALDGITRAEGDVAADVRMRELRVQLLSLFTTPPTNFVEMLNATSQALINVLTTAPRSFVRVLNARKMQLASQLKELETRWAVSGAEGRMHFTIALKSFGERKISVIVAVRALHPALSLRDCLNLVESAPVDICEGVSPGVALAIAGGLKETGAEVEIK